MVSYIGIYDMQRVVCILFLLITLCFASLFNRSNFLFVCFFYFNSYDSHDPGTQASLGYQAAPDETSSIDSEVLDCGKPVNSTFYDDLIGVAQRLQHPIVPEPEVSYLFFSKKDTNSQKTFDIDALERRLKKAKREKPKSVQLYNQIGNFWRIKGDARQSIECFRRALAVSPTNAEVLLNLARVLFNLQFLDDAIYLTRRSLEVQVIKYFFTSKNYFLTIFVFKFSAT